MTPSSSLWSFRESNFSNQVDTWWGKRRDKVESKDLRVLYDLLLVDISTGYQNDVSNKHEILIQTTGISNTSPHPDWGTS